MTNTIKFGLAFLLSPFACAATNEVVPGSECVDLYLDVVNCRVAAGFPCTGDDATICSKAVDIASCGGLATSVCTSCCNGDCASVEQLWFDCLQGALSCSKATCSSGGDGGSGGGDTGGSSGDGDGRGTDGDSDQVISTEGGACFSATSTVHVLNQGPVKMEDLLVGEHVLTGKPGQYTYQPIYAFGHLNKDARAEFYAISTEGSTTPLEMTGEHLIHVVGKSNPVRADSLKVGDALWNTSGDPNGASITSIKVVEKAGLYAPLTADGTLVVNDIAVSTYIALQDSDEEYYKVHMGGGYKMTLASHQSFVHLYLAPFRILCMGVSSDIFQAFDGSGIPHYISLGMRLIHWVGGQSMLIQILFLLVTLPICSTLLVLELVFGSDATPLAIFAGAVLARKANSGIQRQKKTKTI